LIAGVLLAVSYFDAHNHITGILPYEAYANLPAYVAEFSDPKRSVAFEDRLALYRYLADVWYPAQGAALDDRLFSPAESQRFALGARAAIVIYRNQVAGSAVALNGTLERVLTATPWSEFDSAYAFRGGPAGAYLRDRFYGGSDERLSADLCRATILQLAATHIDESEQSLPFLGGWRFSAGKSGPLEMIECVMHAPDDTSLRAALSAMKKPMPSIKIVFMTHTAQLGTLSGGSQYSEWSKTGACTATALPAAIATTPQTIYNALMGWNAGKAVVPATEATRYFGEVVGIDTAAPETTCFTSAGMAYYERLVAAVYRASKARRLAGWHGKLLVHTHVGEGSVIDYAPVPPAAPWSFANLFASLPTTRTNAAQAQANISMLLAAIRRFQSEHPDASRYVIFRLAHVTWASPSQARAMHDAGVEADVNLESNVATGAYPIARMPLGTTLLADRIVPLAQNPATNFELNDLLGSLIGDPADASQVGDVLGDAALKHLLDAHVRCLMGTDAGGVEHSDIVREYAYAASLIAFWKRTDPAFRTAFGNADASSLFANVNWHLADMASDMPLAY
jgi:hypothetical protein